jgi:ferredoxin
MKRKIISIDATKCDGCGDCVSSCPEGAIQLVDGKAKVVRESYCDGLGACLKECPRDAITLEERDAVPYDEKQVIASLVALGSPVVEAHLRHLKDHGELDTLKLALDYLTQHSAPVERPEPLMHSCPGTRSQSIPRSATKMQESRVIDTDAESQLTHWPIQLRLLSPLSPTYREADVILVADCVPFALNDFHEKFLKGNKLAIACPKLDLNQEAYVDKIHTMIDVANVKSITVMMMEVPCCKGLFRLAQVAMDKSSRKIPLRAVTISLDGKVITT